MIVHKQKISFPVPNILIGNRMLFIEVLDTDTEKEVLEAARFVTNAMKEWADIKKVKVTKKQNVNPLIQQPIAEA